jgi:HSP20 family protein
MFLRTLASEKLTFRLKIFQAKTAIFSAYTNWHLTCMWFKKHKIKRVMTLVKFNNNKGANALMPGFNDVFESIFNDTFFNDRMVARVPAVNISETADHFHLELAAPGLKKEDFKISLDQKVLNISVEQQNESKEEDKRFSKREFSYTSFVRSFTLPEMADPNRIEAAYEDGVLKVDIAKKEEAKMASRQIELK